jgi:hypothetical protein
VNLEATGPDEIRAAFVTAIDTAGERSEEVAGIAGVLTEAADRYESLEMAASTVEHLRDAAEQFAAAKATLDFAQEELQAALADFNSKDGVVSEAVDDAGNLASKDVLVDAGTAGADRQAVVKEAYAMVHSGEKTDGVDLGKDTLDGMQSTQEEAAARPPLPDPLHIAERIQLAPGEQVIGSGSVADRDGGLLLAAGVATPDGPRVRLGVGIYDEDKQRWRGADAGATVVLDGDGVEQLADAVEEVIAQAATKRAEFRRICKEDERLRDLRAELESRRFPGRGEQKIQLDWDLGHKQKVQASRARRLEAAAARLGAQDRAAYDALQEQIDAAPHANRWLLREQQAAIICGLTVDEYREMRALEGEFGFRRRTPAEQARLDELDAATGGATDGKRTHRMRGRYVAYLWPYHDGEQDVAKLEQQVAEMEAAALPLDDHTAAELQRVVAEHTAVSDEWEQRAGDVSASAKVAGEWGDLVIEAIQGEEGDVQYRMARRPPGASDEWSPGADGSMPFEPTPNSMRKVVALVRRLVATQGKKGR